MWCNTIRTNLTRFGPLSGFVNRSATFSSVFNICSPPFIKFNTLSDRGTMHVLLLEIKENDIGMYERNARQTVSGTQPQHHLLLLPKFLFEHHSIKIRTVDLGITRIKGGYRHNGNEGPCRGLGRYRSTDCTRIVTSWSTCPPRLSMSSHTPHHLFHGGWRVLDAISV